MSQEFRRVQYVKLTAPEYAQAAGKAFPVTRWEINDSDEIVAVNVEIHPGHCIWVKRSAFTPFIASPDFVRKATEKYMANLRLPGNRRAT